MPHNDWEKQLQHVEKCFLSLPSGPLGPRSGSPNCPQQLCNGCSVSALSGALDIELFAAAALAAAPLADPPQQPQQPSQQTIPCGGGDPHMLVTALWSLKQMDIVDHTSASL